MVFSKLKPASSDGVPDQVQAAGGEAFERQGRGKFSLFLSAPSSPSFPSSSSPLLSSSFSSFPVSSFGRGYNVKRLSPSRGLGGSLGSSAAPAPVEGGARRARVSCVVCRVYPVRCESSFRRVLSLRDPLSLSLSLNPHSGPRCSRHRGPWQDPGKQKAEAPIPKRPPPPLGSAVQAGSGSEEPSEFRELLEARSTEVSSASPWL